MFSSVEEVIRGRRRRGWRTGAEGSPVGRQRAPRQHLWRQGHRQLVHEEHPGAGEERGADLVTDGGAHSVATEGRVASVADCGGHSQETHLLDFDRRHFNNAIPPLPGALTRESQHPSVTRLAVAAHGAIMPRRSGAGHTQTCAADTSSSSSLLSRDNASWS